MYESSREPLLPRRRFLRRLLAHAAAAAVLIAGSLGVGMAALIGLEGLAWHRAFLDAALMLGGGAPLSAPQTVPARVFAGAFSLYGGFVAVVVTGLILAPLAHRVLHRFHLDDD